MLVVLWKPVIQKSLPKNHHKSCLDREIPNEKRVLCSGPWPWAIVSRRGQFAAMLKQEPRDLLRGQRHRWPHKWDLGRDPVQPPWGEEKGFRTMSSEKPLTDADSSNPLPEFPCLFWKHKSYLILSPIPWWKLINFLSCFLCIFILVWLADQPDNVHPQMMEWWAYCQQCKFFLLWNQPTHFCPAPLYVEQTQCFVLEGARFEGQGERDQRNTSLFKRLFPNIYI